MPGNLPLNSHFLGWVKAVLESMKQEIFEKAFKSLRKQTGSQWDEVFGGKISEFQRPMGSI